MKKLKSIKGIPQKLNRKPKSQLMKLPSIQGIPLKYIQSILKIDEDSPSGLIWLPRDNVQWNGKHANKIAGYKHIAVKDSHESWRMKITYNEKKCDIICSRIIFLLHHGYLTEGKNVDHIDNDSLNNNVNNLRESITKEI